MRRRREHSRGDEARVEIPIPAMLDMTFQFLSFFILTFNPPSVAEGQMDLFLPAAGQAKAKSAEQVDPFAFSSDQVDPPTDVTIVIESIDGSISKLRIDEKEKSTPVADLRELRTALSTLHAEIGPGNIKLRADGPLKYGYVIQVMDACLASKFQSVGFAPPSDASKP